MSMNANQGVGSPISNDAYDFLAALHSKLEGMEAYRKYAQDGDQEIWQQLTQLDQQAVQILTQHTDQLFQQGKFRMQQPGQAR